MATQKVADTKTYTDTFPTYGIVTTKKVVRTETRIGPDGHLSFGQYVDSVITNAVENNEVIENISLDITPEQWKSMTGIG